MQRGGLLPPPRQAEFPVQRAGKVAGRGKGRHPLPAPAQDSYGFGELMLEPELPPGVVQLVQGGVVDGVAMRGVDTLLAIPPVLLAMGLVAMTGPGSLNAGIAVSVVGLPQFARLARAGTLGQKRMEYAEAAVALGATDRRILFRGILPNILSPIAVQVPVAASRAILLEASLSFLGLGTQPPAPSWGLMVSESRNYMYAAPWYGMMPGVLIAATVLALNAASDLVRARRGG